MSIPQRPSGKGSRKSHVHFSYVSTHPGKKWGAFIAGPCHWFDCHGKGKTKPCLHELSNGELTCEVCSPFEVPAETGYQPLYRESDGKPTMVIVYGYSRELVDALKLHQHVTVWRPEGQTDSISLLPAMGNAPKYKTTLRERMEPADLTETLLRMWKMPELVEWYRRTHGRGEAVPPPPPPPPSAPKEVLSEKDIRAKMARMFIDKAGGEQPEEIVGAAADEALTLLVEKQEQYRKTKTPNGKR